jgi:hypothetical protein
MANMVGLDMPTSKQFIKMPLELCSMVLNPQTVTFNSMRFVYTPINFTAVEEGRD